jgi:hypothetical protein
MPNNLMRKSTLIATCLLNSKFITDMAFGEQKVKEIFTHMRPKADFDKWNTFVSNSVAQSFIERGRNADTIRVHSFIRELDNF